MCASGSAITDLAVFLPRNTSTAGVTLTLIGPAIEHGHIEPTLARARPFNTKPAPWEASAWEHTFSISPEDRRTRVARLRGVHTRNRGALVAALGIARRPGRSTLTLALETATEQLVREVVVEVTASIEPRGQTAQRWFRGPDAWREAVSLVRSLLVRSSRDGALCDDDRVVFRATSLDRDVRRVAVRTVGSLVGASRQKLNGRLGTMNRRARVGRYATLTVSVESDDWSPDQRDSIRQTPGEPFTVTVARRRDPQGEWAVCVETIATSASPGD